METGLEGTTKAGLERASVEAWMRGGGTPKGDGEVSGGFPAEVGFA